MSAFGSDAGGEPVYTMEFRRRPGAALETRYVGRRELRASVADHVRRIGTGEIVDVKVTNRHGVDVTVDFFG